MCRRLALHVKANTLKSLQRQKVLYTHFLGFPPLNNGQEVKAATWKADRYHPEEEECFLHHIPGWEIWQCESEIDPMSPAPLSKIRPSGQARLGPILRGKAEGAKEYRRLTGTFAFSRCLGSINPSSPSHVTLLSAFPALTLTMLREMIASISNCHWSEKHQGW